MRIRGGGGPKGTSSAGGAGNAGGVGKTQGTRFAGMVGAAQGNGSEEANRVQSAMMQEVAQIAAELQAGKATKEEASRRFVGLVIKQRFGQQKGKGAAKMEEVVSDLVESDPQFVSRLQSQLKRIAGG
jgi:hypothetical protein